MGQKFDEAMRLLDSGVRNIVQSSYDDFCKKNTEFRAKAGLEVVIIREALGECCSWCSDLEGVYTYDTAPDDVYARHRECNCVVSTRTKKGTFQDAWSKKEYNTYRENRIAWAEEMSMSSKEMQRRKIGSQGQEIIDQPTYNKLTKKFLKNDGIIIRGEAAEKHLEGRAYASYVRGGNITFIKDEATVSDVLEEMFHAEQDRKNVFGNLAEREMVLRREIQAQEYLLSQTEKYKIPVSEIEVTKKNLKDYRIELEQYLLGK